jgi:hypothetical protein
VKLTDKTLHVEHGHNRFLFVCLFCLFWPLIAIAWRTDTNSTHQSPQSQRLVALVLVLVRLSCSVLTVIRGQSSADDALSWGIRTTDPFRSGRGSEGVQEPEPDPDLKIKAQSPVLWCKGGAEPRNTIPDADGQLTLVSIEPRDAGPTSTVHCNYFTRLASSYPPLHRPPPIDLSIISFHYYSHLSSRVSVAAPQIPSSQRPADRSSAP